MNNKICVAILLSLALAVIGCAQDQNLGGGRLAGTWDATITISNCETGQTIVSFPSTANFHKGGTFTGITSGMSPALRTPEVGIWRHDTGNNYRFRFKAYQFNSAGVPTIYQIVTHTLQLSEDGNSYESTGGVKFFAMNGVQTGTGCSSGVGTRMNFD